MDSPTEGAGVIISEVLRPYQDARIERKGL